MTVHLEMCFGPADTSSRLAQASRLQGVFLSELYESIIYEPEGCMRSPGQSSHAKQLLPPGYQPAKNVIVSSKKILAQYDHACRAIASGGKSSAKAVGDSDSLKLTRLLGQRQKDVERQVKTLLGVKGGPGKRDILQDTFPGNEEDIWDRYAKVEEDGGQLNACAVNGEGWENAAKHAVRDLQRVVKHLPEFI